MYEESLASHPEAAQKLSEFIASKMQNPIASWGASDKPFNPKGHYPGLRHAHLNRDLSIVYRLYGSNPHVIELYGVYNHAELGTDNPPNIKKQKNQSARFANQSFIS